MHPLERLESVDIDTVEDFLIAEFLYKKWGDGTR